MKRKFLTTVSASLLTAAFLLTGGNSDADAQTTARPITNKYSMKLSQKADGSYELQKASRYAKLVNLDEVEDLLVPFTLERKRLSSKDYKGVTTKDFIYKEENGYSLKITVDFAETDAPAPVVFYLHGGGWARGTNESNRVLSQYMAKQKGVTGVRIQYTLAPQPGANVNVSIQDVLDAVEYVRAHAEEMNVNPSRIGFVGNSAGAHLAAAGAMKCKDAKVFVGYSGIYNLATAAITTRAKDPQRVAYFLDLDPKVLANASPVNMISKKHKIAAQLYCGTADITVEYSQSEEFADKLEAVKGNKVDLEVYKYYDHNLSSNSSDKMEEIFFKTVDFLSENL